MADEPSVLDAFDVSDDGHDLEDGRIDARVRAGLFQETSDSTLAGKYTVLERLGVGGMGIVYAAYDKELDRKIAVKVIKRRANKRSIDRFRREAQAMAKIKHPNVVTIYEVGEHEERVFIAMEFVAGHDLSQLRKAAVGQSYGWRKIIEIYCAAGEGLAAAHRCGVIHRDFTPKNVVRDADGTVKVLDFGLANLVSAPRAPTAPPPTAKLPSREEASTDLGAAGHAATTPRIVDGTSVAGIGAFTGGTLLYMAPELHGHARASELSDQFALCVALYEALYGQHPFVDLPASEDAIVRSIDECRVRRPPSARSVPLWVHAIVVRGLCRDPGQRWPAMADLVAALRADPTPRKRIRLAAITAVLMAVGGAFAWRTMSEAEYARKIATCTADAGAVDSLWADDTKTRISAAFDATGSSYATTALTGVTKKLDTFAATWRTTRMQACVETRVDGTRTAGSFADIEECLDEQRGEFDALLAGLADVQQEGLNKSVEASVSLPDPQVCTDPLHLATRPRLPDDPTARARAEDIRRMQAQASTLQWLGAYDRSREVASAALVAAEAAGLASFIARAHEQLGILLKSTGDYKPAVTAYKQAFFLAGAEGDDRLAARAATDLGFVLARYLGQSEEAQQWISLADMALRRADAEHSVTAANLHNTIATVYHVRGDFTAAIASHHTALKLREELLGKEHLYVGGSLNNLAFSLAMLERWDEARAALERAHAIYVAAVGEDHPDTAILLNGLATVQGKQGDWAGAITTYRRVHTALAAAQSPDSPNTLMCISNMAYAYAQIGQYREAIELQLQAKAAMEHRAPDEGALALLLNNLGANYRMLRQNDDAQAALQQALAIRERLLPPNHPDIAVTLGHLAEVARLEHRLDAAEALAQRALAISENGASGGVDNTAYSLYALAQVRLDQRRFAEARTLFARSAELHERVATAGAQLASSLFGLAEAHLRAGEAAAAIPHLERSAELRSADKTNPGPLAVTQAALGRARWAQGVEPPRARKLVAESLSTLAQLGPEYTTVRAELSKWLEDHPMP